MSETQRPHARQRPPAEPAEEPRRQRQPVEGPAAIYERRREEERLRDGRQDAAPVEAEAESAVPDEEPVADHYLG